MARATVMYEYRDSNGEVFKFTHAAVRDRSSNWNCDHIDTVYGTADFYEAAAELISDVFMQDEAVRISFAFVATDKFLAERISIVE